MESGPRELSLAEWTVLAVVDDAPTHGFAVAQMTAPAGELGRIWQIPRPVVYRAIGRLQELELAVPVHTEPGRGPRRQIIGATPDGSAEVARWLVTPALHVREVRSHLLLKLALLDRRGLDPAELLIRQRGVMEPVVAALAEPSGLTGFEATLVAWRRWTADAVLSFLDEIAAG